MATTKDLEELHVLKMPTAITDLEERYLQALRKPSADVEMWNLLVTIMPLEEVEQQQQRAYRRNDLGYIARGLDANRKEEKRLIALLNSTTQKRTKLDEEQEELLAKGFGKTAQATLEQKNVIADRLSTLDQLIERTKSELRTATQAVQNAVNATNTLRDDVSLYDPFQRRNYDHVTECLADARKTLTRLNRRIEASEKVLRLGSNNLEPGESFVGLFELAEVGSDARQSALEYNSCFVPNVPGYMEPSTVTECRPDKLSSIQKRLAEGLPALIDEREQAQKVHDDFLVQLDEIQNFG